MTEKNSHCVAEYLKAPSGGPFPVLSISTDKHSTCTEGLCTPGCHILRRAYSNKTTPQNQNYKQRRPQFIAFLIHKEKIVL